MNELLKCNIKFGSDFLVSTTRWVGCICLRTSGVGRLFCVGLGSKHFWLCGTHSSVTTSQFCLCVRKAGIASR